jgi:hypothetical protein
MNLSKNLIKLNSYINLSISLIKSKLMDIFIFIIEYVRKEETGDYHRVANHLKHNSISD